MKLERYYVFILAVAFLLTMVYLIVDIETRFYVVAVIYPLIVLIPVMTYMTTFLKVKISREEMITVLVGLVWIAEILYFIAEVIWCWYYNLYLGVEVPYPSEADIFYVSAAITWVTGLVFYLRTFYAVVQPELSRAKKIIGVAAAITIALAVAATYVYAISNWYPEVTPEDVPAFALDIVYSAIDVIEIAIVIAMILVLGGRVGRIVALILASALLAITFDVSFAVLDLLELYYDGHPIELLDLFSYLLDAVALYEARKLFG